MQSGRNSNSKLPLKLEAAVPADASSIAALHIAAAQHLTSIHGQGPWSRNVTERGVLFAQRQASVYVVRARKRIIATLILGTRKPWAIDRRYFTKCNRPLYLTSMAVTPDQQRQGIGRLCITEAMKIARRWPADAICLDAYDAAAGAGEFYRKCGFREVGRVSYRNTPLVYYEMLL